MSHILAFSKRYILLTATITILFAAISEVRASGRATSSPTIGSFWAWAPNKIWDLTGNHRSKTEAISTATCQACLINQAALDKRQRGLIRDLAGDFHRIAIFCKDPIPSGCRDNPLEDYRQERFKNSQYNAIVFVESYGKYKVVPSDGSGENETPPMLDPDGKYHVSGIGFMINECLMLTNKHVAYMKSNKENIDHLEIEISQRRKGADGKYTQLFTTKGEVIAEALKTSDEDKRIEDLVVVRLNQPSPDKAAFIPTCDMKVVAASRSKAVSLATYLPDEKPYGYILMGQRNCTIYGNVNNPGGPWKTDCPTLEGTSGTPALITISEGPDKGKLCSPGIMQGDHAIENYMKLDPDLVFNVMIPFSVALPKNRLDEIKEKYQCSKTTYF